MFAANPFVSFSGAVLVDSSLDFLVRLCKLIIALRRCLQKFWHAK